MTINLVEFGTSLGTRTLGSEIKNTILEDSERTTLNCEGVNVLSHGFCDEIFGKIVESHGVAFLKQNVKVENANEFINRIIKFAINLRIRNAKSNA